MGEGETSGAFLQHRSRSVCSRERYFVCDFRVRSHAELDVANQTPASGAGRKMFLTYPLIDQAISLIENWHAPFRPPRFTQHYYQLVTCSTFAVPIHYPVKPDGGYIRHEGKTLHPLAECRAGGWGLWAGRGSGAASQ